MIQSERNTRSNIIIHRITTQRVKRNINTYKKETRTLSAARSKILMIMGKGDNNKYGIVKFVPKIGENVLFVGKLTQSQTSAYISKDQCTRSINKRW